MSSDAVKQCTNKAMRAIAGDVVVGPSDAAALEQYVATRNRIMADAMETAISTKLLPEGVSFSVQLPQGMGGTIGCPCSGSCCEEPDVMPPDEDYKSECLACGDWCFCEA